MNEFQTALVVGLITSVIGGIIANFMTRSPEIKDYFVDALWSLAKRMTQYIVTSLITVLAEGALVLADSFIKPVTSFMKPVTMVVVIIGLLKSMPLTMIWTVLMIPLRLLFKNRRDYELEGINVLEVVLEAWNISLVYDILSDIISRFSFGLNFTLFSLKQNTPHTANQIAQRSGKIYEGTLLKIYSRGYRKEFGDQMACAFEEQCRETWANNGLIGFLRVWGITIIFDVSVGLRDRFSKSADSPQKEIQR